MQAQAEQLKASKLRWYDYYINGEISKAEYLKLKAETDQRLADHELAVRREQERMNTSEASRPNLNEGLDELCRKFAASDALTAELTHALIKAIYIHGANRIEIEWRFKDILREHELEL